MYTYYPENGAYKVSIWSGIGWVRFTANTDDPSKLDDFVAAMTTARGDNDE